MSVKPKGHRFPACRPWAGCGSTQQSPHEETHTKTIFRPANHGQRVARPNSHLMEKPIRKPFSDPPTMGGVWLDPTVTSWRNPYENNCPTRQQRATCGPTKQSPHGETNTKTVFRPADHGRLVARPNSHLLEKPIR